MKEDKFNETIEKRYTPMTNFLANIFLPIVIIITIIAFWIVMNDSPIYEKLLFTLIMIVFGVIAYFWTKKWHKPIMKGSLKKMGYAEK
ncbi:MAG: hypothetical protein KKF56_04255 [Nanoarchaeota archaeon]|nr:hypothetical protein [Nanoarchaeota archaeon]